MTVHSNRQQAIEAIILARIESVQQKKSAAAALDKSSYHNETRRPIVCLLFVLPLIVAYELGTILLGSSAHRSGVDQWLEQLLHCLGFGQLVLLPLLTVAIMIVWHHRNDDHWRVRLPVFSGMIIETIGLGLMLFWAASAFHLFTQSALVASIPATPRVTPKLWWSTTIALVGSGIYEELFFRLMLLLPAIVVVTKRYGVQQAKWLGVAAVSLLFAALHYNFINPAGAIFEWSTFAFRFAASIMFSLLFLYRGFGIAVGTHVAFDVLTQL